VKHKSDLAVAPAIPQELAGRFPHAVEGLSRYADLLAGPGIDRGLIGPREMPRLWDRHIENSLALEVLVPQGADVIDVGSGAGLPGWPLALVRPDLRIILLEPMARRCAFLEHCRRELGRPDVTIVRARAQDVKISAHVVVARAVAPMAELAAMAWGLVAPDGELLALKGERAAQEVADAESSGVLSDLGVSAEVLALGDPAPCVVRIVRAA
jgi:16S rRNA (guanine527-N7)-methyltransferase